MEKTPAGAAFVRSIKPRFAATFGSYEPGSAEAEMMEEMMRGFPLRNSSAWASGDPARNRRPHRYPEREVSPGAAEDSFWKAHFSGEPPGEPEASLFEGSSKASLEGLLRRPAYDFLLVFRSRSTNNPNTRTRTRRLR